VAATAEVSRPAVAADWELVVAAPAAVDLVQGAAVAADWEPVAEALPLVAAVVVAV
jgi:hypothetical protein